jgi:hypothetical protein
MANVCRSKQIFAVTLLSLSVLTVSSGIAGTVIAASCSQNDVQAAVNDSVDGDTVLVPPGTCAWTSSVSIPATKGIVLQGAGIGNTVISITSGNALDMEGVEGTCSRVTGFTFNRTGSDSTIHINGTCKAWRFDNNRLTGDKFHDAIVVKGITYGVIDHNVLVNGRVLVSSSTLGHDSWLLPLTLGTANAVYIEDNEYPATVFSNAVDANKGARFVFRYNTLTDTYVEAHSGCQNHGRGVFSWEIYGNTFNTTKWIYRPFLLRAGTGVVYDNVLTGQWTRPKIDVDDQRSCLTCGGLWSAELCNGNSAFDGNNVGENGYPCRDQIGRSTDDSLFSNAPYPAQALEPAYAWDNTYGGTGVLIEHNPALCSNSENHIQENRDYFNNAERPNYTPYPYPHPLVLGAQPPNAPQGLRTAE